MVRGLALLSFRQQVTFGSGRKHGCRALGQFRSLTCSLDGCSLRRTLCFFEGSEARLCLGEEMLRPRKPRAAKAAHGEGVVEPIRMPLLSVARSAQPPARP